ncbi:hypothetical protein T440DRAFT_97197 [Plenodomus tracheiphilus IPT5]|uniref:Zn(2)-C6 fungal-type domain-containing protein n=1 Tax=Plenodomus tracheiphilus IPT5 TaxID=1408161 RepID=A0A6A7BL81_9PLEO|nr:hypothetical protein T440DRAFT_97197 [Plenodomus tracheiphilus IPT5]
MSSGPPKKKRRGGPRRRTGNQTCKRRHIRCDEKKPKCGSCERLELECEQSEDSTWIATHENLIDAPPNQTFPTLIDIFRSRISDLEPVVYEPALPEPTLGLSNQSPQTIDGAHQNPREVTLSSESAFLLQTYVRTVARWMDIFDHASTYQHVVPQLALRSPLMFHCVCAFTANHLALSNGSRDPSWRLIAAKHYGEALRLLINALSLPSHEHTLTASMLLLSYEIHEAQRSEDYRRHFLGLTMLIKARGSSAQSTGIERANSWIYIRHEIVVAMANKEPLILDPREWAVSWRDNESREDVLGNHVLWILARVLNLVFGPDGTTEAGKAIRQGFLQEIETWRAGLSDTFVGIKYGNKFEDGFSKVYFPVVAAAAAAFWYHITHILLYTEPCLQDQSYVPLIQDEAMKVTNIAISDFPPALMVFSSHGLFYAAKHIQGISRKARIWNVLNDVEKQTGYSTGVLVKQLQDIVEHN